MAHHTEQQGFPAVSVIEGMRLRLRAISPTTGNAVTGVTAREWAVYGRDESEPPEEPVQPVEWLEV